MGAWGVKAIESDYGLDLLALVEERYLRERNYERFSVCEVMVFLKEHITQQIRHTNRGASDEAMLEYIEYNFPGCYDQAVVLMAELLVKYFERGNIVLDVYERGKEPISKTITNMICSGDDLNGLLTDLQTVLDPDRDLYRSWESGDYFHEWQAHVQALCDDLKNQIDR